MRVISLGVGARCENCSGVDRKSQPRINSSYVAKSVVARELRDRLVTVINVLFGCIVGVFGVLVAGLFGHLAAVVVALLTMFGLIYYLSVLKNEVVRLEESYDLGHSKFIFSRLGDLNRR